MKKIIFLLALISIVNLPIYPQIIENIYLNKPNTKTPFSNDTSYSSVSLNTYFTYMFMEHKRINFSNAKGFGFDLQINQNNYTSWMIGLNISFYKRNDNDKEIYNLSTLNVLLGPKFSFTTSRTSMYARINAGVTFFSENTLSGKEFSVSLFPAFGFEYNISKKFKFFIEPMDNLYFDLGGPAGEHFSINLGLISSF